MDFISFSKNTQKRKQTNDPGMAEEEKGESGESRTFLRALFPHLYGENNAPAPSCYE